MRQESMLGSAIAAALLVGCTGDRDSEVVYLTETITETVTETITVPGEEGLQPGYYQPVLTEIQRVQGAGGALGVGGAGASHMHVTKLHYREGAADRPDQILYCSYTFGVLDATNPTNLQFQAQGFKHLPRTGTRDPGCFHLVPDADEPDIVYTTHHGNLSDGAGFLSGWDLRSFAADPDQPTRVTLDPVQLPMLQEPDVAYEGLDYAHGYIWVALHDGGLGVYGRDALGFYRVATYEDLENAWAVKIVGDTALVADGIGGLVALDVSDPEAPSFLSRLVFPGQSRDIAVAGDVAYVAAQSGGVVSVDISDFTQMRILDTVHVPGSAIAVDVDPTVDRLYLGAWNDARVYDVSDPSRIEIIGGVRQTVNKNYAGDGGDRPDITSRVLAVAGRGDMLFDGTWWVPYTYQIHADRAAPYLYLPEQVNYLAFPGDLAVGESSSIDLEVRNDGTAPLTLYDVWATDSAFTVSPEQLRLQPGSSGVLTLTFTATVGDAGGEGEETALLNIWSDDPSQPVRQAWLVGNQEGAGVGDPFPETTATLLDGTEWSFTADALGDVTLVVYFATFCPVCSHHLPDVEVALHQKYRDQGLKVIALNANAADALEVGAVANYFSYLGPTYPAGIETSGTYAAFRAIYDGANPFPVDIIIDRSGVIRYVAREYDLAAMEAVILDLL